MCKNEYFFFFFLTATDDWGRNVESAIAAVLRRDGIEPLQLPASVAAKHHKSTINEIENISLTQSLLSSPSSSSLKNNIETIQNSPDTDRRGAKRRRKSRHQISRTKKVGIIRVVGYVFTKLFIKFYIKNIFFRKKIQLKIQQKIQKLMKLMNMK